MHYFHKSINNKTLFYAWFPAMNTRIDILFMTDYWQDKLVLIAENIKTEIERLENMANRFDKDSELSKINKSAFEKPIPISTEMFQILAECLHFNTETFGYFDITINSANGLTEGISKVKINKEDKSIQFLHPDLQLDLSGFIKGYSLRTIKKILMDEKIGNALINIGNSSILALGNHPNGNGWKIGIPNEDNLQECMLIDKCLTTSGNTKSTKWPIKRPSTSKTIQNSKLMSVITDDPAVGEVLSIALYLANEDEKQTILKKLQGNNINLN